MPTSNRTGLKTLMWGFTILRRRHSARLLWLLGMTIIPALGFTAPIEIDLRDHQMHGLLIAGARPEDSAGSAVSGIGDINGDGLADFAIGAPLSDAGAINGGAVYVIYGHPSYGHLLPSGMTLIPDELEPHQGYAIVNLSRDSRLGVSVSGAGDVNGDGLHDFIVGANRRARDVGVDPGGGAGAAYLVYGSRIPPNGPINVDALGPSDAVRIVGAASRDTAGTSVSGAGDFDGDGFDDVIVGAPAASSAHGAEGGAAYVIYGSDALPGLVDLRTLSAPLGFRLEGVDSFDRFGQAVSGAGDVNADGFDDVVIGAPGADRQGNDALTGAASGAAYVAYGTPVRRGAMYMGHLVAESGFVLIGDAAGSGFGLSVAGIGDADGDGVDDLLIGAPDSAVDRNPINDGDDDNDRTTDHEDLCPFDASNSCAVAPECDLEDFDRDGDKVCDEFDSDDDNDGSPDASDLCPLDPLNQCVVVDCQDSGGDFDGDQICGDHDTDDDNDTVTDLVDPCPSDDLNQCIAPMCHGSGDDLDGDRLCSGIPDIVGVTHLIYGVQAPTRRNLDIKYLQPDQGRKFLGEHSPDGSGTSVAGAGDVNGDGFSDLLIGASNADRPGAHRAGAAYVVFGSRTRQPMRIDLRSLDEELGFKVLGPGHADGEYAGTQVSSAGDVNGDGLADLLVGVRAATTGGEAHTGSAYLMFRPFVSIASRATVRRFSLSSPCGGLAASLSRPMGHVPDGSINGSPAARIYVQPCSPDDGIDYVADPIAHLVREAPSDRGTIGGARSLPAEWFVVHGLLGPFNLGGAWVTLKYTHDEVGDMSPDRLRKV